ncbi:MAG: probable integrase [Leptospirillum rubarum]|nr:MAG: probable integrase [Leptospirillum rubarum]
MGSTLLYQEIGHLTTQLTWLKKVRDELSHDQRRSLVETENSDLSLVEQTALVGISRSGLFYRPVPPSDEEIRFRHRIDEIYTQWSFDGSRRITAVLQKDGFPMGRKSVQRAMQDMGIERIHPGTNLSKRALGHKIYPYLLRNVVPQFPHHVWGIDITCFRLIKGWMYLVAIVDWYSRYLVS